MRKDRDCTDVWQKYQNGIDYHNRINLYQNTERAYNFYEGRQWAGLQNGGDELPFYNFIRPTVNLKVASVAMNNMDIVYSPMNAGEEQEMLNDVCKKLNGYAAQLWEHQKMQSNMWDMNRDAAISGNAYMYFYDQTKCQMMDTTAIYFADEQNPDIQEQPYIIIAERRMVDDIRREAKENGIPEDEITMIVGDSDTEHVVNVDGEVHTDNGKCTSLLYFTRKDGIVHFSRAVKNVVYKPLTSTGCEMYPIVGLTWGERKNSARGIGDVTPMIPNQIEVNKTLARRSIAVKMAAFPRLAYVADKVDNPDDLEMVGAHIAINETTASAISNYVGYLNPAPISSDAKMLTDELVQTTRELAGAGDAAMGNIDPEKASGTAIMAVRDQSMIPLNEQVQAYQQLIEDIARVWYALWVAYNPNGLEVTYSIDGQNMQETIPAQILQALDISIKVDVSPANPFSRYAQEQSIQNLFQAGAITFEEYVSVLDEQSVMPKAKLEQILADRQAAQAEQMAIQQAQMMQQEQMMQQAAAEEQVIAQQEAAVAGQEAQEIAELQSLAAT